MNMRNAFYRLWATALIITLIAPCLYAQKAIARTLNRGIDVSTSIAIFRPLRNKIGGAAALMISFIFSDLLHELALSVPVNNGYGLPTLYFVIHGSVVLMERAMRSRGVKFLENKLIARLWIFFWLVVPMPLLFHPHFIKEIVWPLAGLGSYFAA